MLLDDIATLISSGGSTSDGTIISKGMMPPQPDNVVTVYETGGQTAYRRMGTGISTIVAERPRIQVVARAGQYDYAVARLKVNEILQNLESVGDRTVNGVRYLWIASVQSPFLLRRDEINRPLVAVNFDVVKEFSTA